MHCVLHLEILDPSSTHALDHLVAESPDRIDQDFRSSCRNECARESRETDVRDILGRRREISVEIQRTETERTRECYGFVIYSVFWDCNVVRRTTGEDRGARRRVRVPHVTPRGKQYQSAGNWQLWVGILRQISHERQREIAPGRVSFDDDVVRRESQSVHEIVVSRKRVDECSRERVRLRVRGRRRQPVLDRESAKHRLNVVEESAGDGTGYVSGMR
ncbi:unnamed protein product [Mycena citricolor]|uniref:Uncharacterized protein n=1 Tax=Mycena citricolor TaxID=2018698 RepID=A0AAD2HV86_9AGAR|nr:unnamed protein product [Mycena citricolor]